MNQPLSPASPKPPASSPLSELLRREEALTLRFQSADTLIYDSFSSKKHYVLIATCPSTLRQELANNTATFRQSKAITLTDPAEYHATICTWPLAVPAIALRQARVVCKQRRGELALLAKGVHVRPQGIFIGLYDLDGSLSWLRSQLAERTGAQFNNDPRLLPMGWITLGRFTAAAPPAAIRHAKQHVQDDFGSYDWSVSLRTNLDKRYIGPRVPWESL